MSTQKKQYIIIADSDNSIVSEKVCDKLKEGYILYGPLTSREYEYCQAMILPEIQPKFDLTENISI